MTHRPLLLVGATLIAALAALVLLGQRILERDRAELFDRYARERSQAMEEAARDLAADVADIGEDLELASILMAANAAQQHVERELHAIATIKREYLAMRARTGAETTNVTAYDAPPGAATRSDRVLEQMLDLAERAPGALHASTAFAEPGEPAAWYRVFARRSQPDGPVVAVVVDTAVLLNRMRLQRSPLTRTAILDARGAATLQSDRRLAAVASRVTAGSIIDGDLATAIGLPDTDAVAIAVPLSVDAGPPWTLLVAASTEALQEQQARIVRRVLAGGALVLVLLITAGAYVVHNAVRARTLRERVQHTERLAHLTEKAEKILDHIPSGVLALSEDRRVTGVNRWLAERLQRDVIGQQLETAFGDERIEDIALVLALVEQALATRQPQSLHRERLALLGRDASLNIHAVPLAHGFGDVSVLLVFDDLTELHRIEQRLLHSEKLVTAGQLAAGIAHEVGTPLNVARGRVELALSHLGAEHAEADNHRVVLDQIDRVTRLIQQLLDYVRPAPVAIQEVDLERSLHAVKELLAPAAAKRLVSVEVDVSTSAASLRADPDQVQQIVVNLALNAIDACAPRDTVVLRTRRGPRAILLEVIDTGHGIPRELHEQVFDPFFTTKKRGQGTGLGLWVVAQLVRAHAAEIELDSTPGRGTTVRIAWPVTA